MSETKRKDVSFWIGVAVAVALVDAALIVAAIFLLKSNDSTVAAGPAPAIRNPTTAAPPPPREAVGRRGPAPDQAVPVVDSQGTINTARSTNAMTTADTGRSANSTADKKTYSWQVARPQPGILDSTPPQVKIVPTEFANGLGSWSMRANGRAVGMRQTPEMIIMNAYDWNAADRSRVTLPDQMPAGQYDYIANLPSGALEALQAEAKDKLGLTASRETRDTTALVLKVNHADAPGLKPGTPQNGPREAPVQGTTSMRNQKMAALARRLEAISGMPVLDQTGLTGNYDMEFSMIRPTPRGQKFAGLEEAQKILLEQLGLDLIQTNAPVEMLVVKKVN